MITLTTDFGLGSPYVAQMKGAILSVNPQVELVDICHAIPPQDVRGGALVLGDVCRWFPAGTIHVAVVDPGVGTRRSLVCASCDSQYYIAPDNGLLSLVCREQNSVRWIQLADRRYWNKQVSPTFHGRDIMGPVAAHLSLGVEPACFGPCLAEPVLLDWPRPRRIQAATIGEVICVDSFGNLITNIDSCLLPDAALLATARIRCCGREILGIVSTYGDASRDQPAALIGSAGRLEIAVVCGSAAEHYGARVGDEVVVEFPG